MDFSAGSQEGHSDLLCLVLLPGGLLQASTSRSTSPGSHGTDLAGHTICSPAHETSPVAPERSVVESVRTEPSGVHECRLGSGPSVVDGGVDFAGGETFYASSTHCRCDKDASMVGWGSHAQGLGLHSTLFHRLWDQEERLLTSKWSSKQIG